MVGRAGSSSLSGSIRQWRRRRESPRTGAEGAAGSGSVVRGGLHGDPLARLTERVEGRLSGVHSAAAAARVDGELGTPWSIRLHLIECRDVPHREGAGLPDLICCVSVLQLSGQSPPSTSAAHAIDHSVNLASRGASSQHASYRIVEQQARSRAVRRSLSPVWNQSFTLTEAVPSARGAESQRVPVSGQAMLLLLTVHDVGSAAHDALYARATHVFKAGPPEEHWVLLRSRAGVPLVGPSGRPTALHLRLHYSQDPLHASSVAAAGDDGFWS